MPFSSLWLRVHHAAGRRRPRQDIPSGQASRAALRPPTAAQGAPAFIRLSLFTLLHSLTTHCVAARLGPSSSSFYSGRTLV